MVSRRTFAAITMLMAIILFLFQGLNLAKEKLNHYEKNAYAAEKEDLEDGSGAFGTEDASGEKNITGSRGTIVYIGEAEEHSVGAVVCEWCRYMKYEAAVYPSMRKYEQAMEKKGAKQPEMIVVNSESIDWTALKDVIDLQDSVDEGIHVVFANLPEVSVIRKNQKLRELLGIAEVKEDSTTVTGLDLYDNLMLGGENIYRAENKEEENRQDLKLTFPWFKLGDGTKTYMKGFPEDQTLKTQDYPVVIWRKNFGTASVFAVNGDYMEDETGLGLLTGMVYETRNYLIYPIVNAQNLVVQNFPSLAEENTDKMQEIYGNGTKDVNRDIVWPSIAAIYRKNHFGLTCMVAPKLDYDAPAEADGELLHYYAKLLNEEKGEMGLSGFTESETSVKEKLDEDQSFMQKNLSDFYFSSFFSGNLSEQEMETALQQSALGSVRTVVKSKDTAGDLVSYLDAQTTQQKIVTEDTGRFTYRSWMKMKSIESALGYASVELDLSRVIYPKTEEDRWEKIVKEFASNLGTYWQPFSGFDGTTVSTCDSRIRTFLNLRCEDEREGDTITLKTTGTEKTAYYVIRTHNESVEKVTGGTAEKLEDSAWLIRAEKSEVTITLRASDRRYYYEEGVKNE